VSGCGSENNLIYAVAFGKGTKKIPVTWLRGCKKIQRVRWQY